jgi:hypothetical protein
VRHNDVLPCLKNGMGEGKIQRAGTPQPANTKATCGAAEKMLWKRQQCAPLHHCNQLLTHSCEIKLLSNLATGDLMLTTVKHAAGCHAHAKLLKLQTARALWPPTWASENFDELPHWVCEQMPCTNP